MRSSIWRGPAGLLALAICVGCSAAAAEPQPRPEALVRLSPAALPQPAPDVSNRYADDPAAAELGQRFFFEPEFSGPLLDSDNDGNTGTLGVRGQSGKVSCAGCHVPTAGFVDNRSARQQVSLAAAWGKRRAPSLLDVGQAKLL